MNLTLNLTKKSSAFLAPILFPLLTLAQTPWTDRVSVKGDLRVRGDNIKDDANSSGTREVQTERNRLRLRARLAVTGKVNDNTDAVFRIATGSTDQSSVNSTNQDMTGYGAKKDFNLDLAYANWKSSDSAQVWIGKSPVPYFQPGNSDLLFDTDLTQEGLAYKDQWKGESLSLFWNTGYWLLNERHISSPPTTATDVTLVGADLGVNGKAGDLTYVVGVGYLDFANIKETATTTPAGNSLTGGAFTYEYKVSRAFLELGLPVAGLPITLYGDYARNGNPTDDNTANLVGVRLGKVKDIGSWQVSVDSRDLKKDASIGILTDSDSAGGGTDTKTLRFNAQYQYAEAVTLAATYYDSKRLASTQEIPYKRAQLDLNFNF